MVIAVVSMALAMPAFASEEWAREPDTGSGPWVGTGALIGAGVGTAAWGMLGGIQLCFDHSSWCGATMPYLGLLAGIGAGLGLLVGGTAYWISQELPRRVTLLPVVGPKSQGLALVGTF
jgi:hypothetical protein